MPRSPSPAIDPRVWPLLVLGAMFAWGCRAGPGMMSPYVVNSAPFPVTVEYRGQTDGEDIEKLSVQLPPGGTFQRQLVGYDLRAGAVVTATPAEGQNLRLDFDSFRFGRQAYVIERTPEGLVARQTNLPEPERPQ